MQADAVFTILAFLHEWHVPHPANGMLNLCLLAGSLALGLNTKPAFQNFPSAGHLLAGRPQQQQQQ
jgi:hypothetical protein